MTQRLRVLPIRGEQWAQWALLYSSGCHRLMQHCLIIIVGTNKGNESMAQSRQAGMCDRCQNKGYKQALDRTAYCIVMKLAGKHWTDWRRQPVTPGAACIASSHFPQLGPSHTYKLAAVGNLKQPVLPYQSQHRILINLSSMSNKPQTVLTVTNKVSNNSA